MQNSLQIKYFLLFTLILTWANLSFAQTDTNYNSLENYDVLNEVVVSTNKDASKLKESVVGLSVLKPYILQNKIALDAGKVLGQTPGVVVTDGQINIRSGSGWSYGTGSRVMVTLDGMPMLAGDVGSVPFNLLPTELVDGIEVIKNAGSVLYGSSAINGVVELRSMPISTQQFVKFNIIGGFYQFPNSDLKYKNSTAANYGFNGIFTQKFDRHSLAIYWNQLNDDGFRMSEHDYRVRMGWKYGFEFRNKLKPLKLWLNGMYQKGESGSFLIWESAAKGYNTQDSSYSFNIGKRFNIDPIIEWNGKIWNHKFQNRYFSINNDLDNGDPNKNQDNKNYSFYSEWKSKRSFLYDLIDLTFGGVSYYVKTMSPIFMGDHQSQNLAGYSQVQLKYKRLIAQVGARYEHFKLDSLVQSKPVYRAGVNYHVGKATFLRASYGQGYRFPSMAELFTLTSTGNIAVLPNANLKPETSESFELGIKQGLKLGNKQSGIISTFIDVSLFQTNLNNMMEYTFANWKEYNTPFGFKSVNVGTAQIRGIEFESVGVFEKGKHSLKWILGYTYSNPICKDTNYIISKIYDGPDVSNITFGNSAASDNNVLKYRNRHVFRADLQYTFGKIELGGSLRYQSRFENIDAAFNIFIADVEKVYRNGSNSGSIIDLRAGYRLNEFIKVQMQVSNIMQVIYMDRPANYNAPRFFQFQLSYQVLEKPKLLRKVIKLSPQK